MIWVYTYNDFFSLQINDIRIPFKKGSLDEVETEGPDNSVEDTTVSSQQIYTKEARYNHSNPSMFTWYMM